MSRHEAKLTLPGKKIRDGGIKNENSLFMCFQCKKYGGKWRYFKDLLHDRGLCEEGAWQ
jgi:hypothetical protein